MHTVCNNDHLFQINILVELITALIVAIEMRESNQMMCPMQRHSRVSQMYHWPDVVRRTDIVYQSAIRSTKVSWRQRLARYSMDSFGIEYCKTENIRCWPQNPEFGKGSLLKNQNIFRFTVCNV